MSKEKTICSNPVCKKAERKVSAFMVCSNCKEAHYCSRSCQKKHWKSHRNDCKKVEPEEKQEEEEEVKEKTTEIEKKVVEEKKAVEDEKKKEVSKNPPKEFVEEEEEEEGEEDFTPGVVINEDDINKFDSKEIYPVSPVRNTKKKIEEVDYQFSEDEEEEEEPQKKDEISKFFQHLQEDKLIEEIKNSKDIVTLLKNKDTLLENLGNQVQEFREKLKKEEDFNVRLEHDLREVSHNYRQLEESSLLVNNNSNNSNINNQSRKFELLTTSFSRPIHQSFILMERYLEEQARRRSIEDTTREIEERRVLKYKALVDRQRQFATNYAEKVKEDENAVKDLKDTATELKMSMYIRIGVAFLLFGIVALSLE